MVTLMGGSRHGEENQLEILQKIPSGIVDNGLGLQRYRVYSPAFHCMADRFLRRQTDAIRFPTVILPFTFVFCR